MGVNNGRHVVIATFPLKAPIIMLQYTILYLVLASIGNGNGNGNGKRKKSLF